MAVEDTHNLLYLYDILILNEYTLPEAVFQKVSQLIGA